MRHEIRIILGDAGSLPEVMALIRAVGWSRRLEDVHPTLELGRPWLAVEKTSGTTLGVAVWWPMEPDAGRVGQVIVSPDAQGRGIGRALMERIMEDVGTRSLSLLATEAGQPLYRKLGFESIAQNQRHEGICSLPARPDPRVRPARPSDMAAIHTLDGRALGLKRTAILEHLLGAGDVFVIGSGENVTGYAVNRVFGRGRVIAPIVAGSEEDAVALFEAVASPGHLRVDRPVGTDKLASSLLRHGVVGHEVEDSMVLGRRPDKDTVVRAFAMASHGWG